MIDNRQAKDELRLKQCAVNLRALISEFGEPIVLDALAIVCETPDGKKLLSTAAACSREMETGPDVFTEPGRSDQTGEHSVQAALS